MVSMLDPIPRSDRWDAEPVAVKWIENIGQWALTPGLRTFDRLLDVKRAVDEWNRFEIVDNWIEASHARAQTGVGVTVSHIPCKVVPGDDGVFVELDAVDHTGWYSLDELNEIFAVPVRLKAPVPRVEPTLLDPVSGSAGFHTVSEFVTPDWFGR